MPRRLLPLALAVLVPIAPSLRAQSHGAAETKANLERLRPFLEEEPALRAAIEAAAPATLATPFQEPRNVLVLTTGTMGILHAPGASGLLLLLRATAAKHPDLRLTEVFTEEGLTAEKLAKYDAVILNNVGRIERAEEETFYRETLPAYVRAGGGLWANHAAAHMFFDQPEHPYNQLLGGFSSKGKVHPPRQGAPFRIHVEDPGNPLVRAFQKPDRAYRLGYWWYAGPNKKPYNVAFTAPEELADEINIVRRGAAEDYASRVLLRMADEDPDRYAADLPRYSRSLIWVRRIGEGRVYYVQFGHNMALFSVASVAQAMIDGLQYATGDLAAPDAATPPPAGPAPASTPGA